MAKDSKSVTERAKEIRDFSNKVSTVSDEDLEKVVGGIGGGPGRPASMDIDWFVDALNEHLNSQGRG